MISYHLKDYGIRMLSYGDHSGGVFAAHFVSADSCFLVGNELIAADYSSTEHLDKS